VANLKQQRVGLRQGTVDKLILRTLLNGPAHGHSIGKHIQRTTNDVLQMQHGSLYSRVASSAEAGMGCLQMGDGSGSQSGIQVLPTNG
jgi:PadR family transcriptional regulator, regulatory protein PadR